MSGTYQVSKDRALLKHVPRTQCNALSKNKVRTELCKELRNRGLDVDEKDYFRLGTLYDFCDLNALDVEAFKEQNRAVLRCANNAIPGGLVCTSHGGATPSAIEYAKTRMAGLVDPAISRLSKIITQGKHEASVVTACKDVLDRNGLKRIDKIQESFGYDPAKLAELSDEELNIFMKIVRKLSASGELISMVPMESQVSLPPPVEMMAEEESEP